MSLSSLTVAIVATGCNLGANDDVACPGGTRDLDGLCAASCRADDDCLVSEICDIDLGACVHAVGEKPRIVKFIVHENPISRGRPVRIDYEVAGATSVEIGPDVLEATQTLSGSTWTSALDQPMSLELIARGPGGRAMRTLAIEVIDTPSAPVITEFSATPNPVPEGGFATLAWTVAGADGIAIVKKSDRTVIHTTTENVGSVAYFPSSAAVLILSATNAIGVVERELLLDFDAPGPKIAAFNASASAVIPGANVVLSWSTSMATVLSVQDESGTSIFSTSDRDAVGTGELLVPLMQPHGRAVFTLHVSDGVIDAEPARVEIAVHAAPEIARFDVTPSTFMQSAANTVSLEWETAGASALELLVDQASIPGAVGEPSGSTSIAVAGSPAIELVASSAAGSVRERRRVWQIVDERENNDSRNSAERIGGRAIRNACRNETVDQHDWFELDAGSGGNLRVAISDGARGCPDFAAGTIVEAYREGVRLGAVRFEGGGTCPVIDPAVHAFARDLGAGGGAVHLHVMQPGAAGCGPWVLEAEMIGRGCGNGLLENGEACDDGNSLDGDGCASVCSIERGSEYSVSSPSAIIYQRVPGEELTFRSYDGRFSASDEGVAEVSLPFSFGFFGRPYERLRVYVDGYVSFSEVEPASATDDDPLPIPSRSSGDAVIAALWSDLVIEGAGSRVVTLVMGSAPNRKFVVEYQNIRTYDPMNAEFVRANAQIVLEEGSNAIELRYGDNSLTGSSEVILYAGIENHQGRFGYTSTADCKLGCSVLGGELPRNLSIRFEPR